MRENSGAVIVNFNAPIEVEYTHKLIEIVNKMRESKQNRLIILMSSDSGNPIDALSIFNFLNGIKDFHITTHNIGIIAGVSIPLFCVGHVRTCAPSARFDFQDVLYPLLEDTAKDYDFDEILKILQISRLELAKTIAYKVGQTEEYIIQLMRQGYTMLAEQAVQFKLVSSIEEKFMKPGDTLVSIQV